MAWSEHRLPLACEGFGVASCEERGRDVRFPTASDSPLPTLSRHSAFDGLVSDLDPGNVGLLGEQAGLSIVSDDQIIIVDPNCLNPWAAAYAIVSGSMIGIGHERVTAARWAVA